MGNRKLLVVRIAALALIGLTGCGGPGKSSPAPAAPPAQTTSAAQTRTAPKPVSLVFQDELNTFNQQRATAIDLGDSYPADADALVRFTTMETDVVSTALGAAITKGNRAQIDAYIKGGTNLKFPIWYAAGNEIHRSSAAHQAIRAVFSKDAEPDFFKFILDAGAGRDDMETTYYLSSTATVDRYDESSVLFHTVTSEIHELTKIVLDAGVSDLNTGVIGANGNTMSPLTMCVVRANVEAVRLLLEAGIDPASVPSDLVTRRLPGDPEQTKRREEIEALISARTKPAAQ